MVKAIQYPSAYVEPYEPVDISDARKGRTYYCLGCGQEMVIKRGMVRRHHFAHKPPFTECDSDNALHEIAKANICQGLLQALDSGGEYRLGYPCLRCQGPIMVNLAVPGASVASERSVIQDTRSDLVVTKPDGVEPRVIIEIVVSHDLERKTQRRYEDAAIPVVKVKPIWETVSNLLVEAAGCETLNIETRFCQVCRKKEAEEKRRAEERRSEVARLLEGMVPHPGKAPQLVKPTHDKYGSPLKSYSRDKILSYAYKLAGLGFKQQKRPTLFLFQTGDRQIYADLDSTEVMKVWEVDCAPAIYSFPLEGGTGCRECVLQEVEEILDKYGIPCRRHFMDNIGHDHGWGEYSDGL